MAWIVTRFSFLLLLLSISSAQAGLLDSLIDSEPKFLPVGEAFPFLVDQQGSELSVIWDSVDEYYLYKKKMYLKQGKQKFKAIEFSEEGELKHDEAFGEVIVYYHQVEARFDLKQFVANTPTILGFQGCADAGLCYPPQKIELDIDWTAVQADQARKPSLTQAESATKAATKVTIEAETTSWIEGKSWFSVVGLFFILGLGLTFTPCVLPMVPILTSIVIGQKKHTPAKGFVLSTTYVMGMAITYAAAGVAVGLLGAGANIQAWMQTPWILTIFAILFLALSLSMFGLYELQLPSGLRNRLNNMNQKQKGGSLISVFLMGVLSALVVSPCVSAPLAGALVYLSTTGDAWLGGSALLALGLGMGTPLIILGTSGASIMPKAGGWMDQIKAFFGILLIGVAIWLLSRFLDATLILAMWGVLAIVYAIYLGAIEPIEPAQTGIKRTVKGIGFVILVYGVLALIGALQGNDDPLKPLTSSYASGGINNPQAHSNASPFENIENKAQLDAAIKNHLVANPNGAVMLDYYADWCIACKVMEKAVFHEADVQAHWPELLWLQIDVTDQTQEQIDLMTEFNLFGPPSLLFFTADGELDTLRILGEMHKEEFVQHLNKVKATL
ncbi:MAG: protein-disulfide reductase DsbD [Oleispira sp.]|nr:protein-disulfide reductase DsbD [Oleispira sp.]MBL4882342.1 protein-disulfide reductase DsbD [Oleispira sp.]